MVNDDFIKEIGDLNEFERQREICQEQGLTIIGPVYKSWKPQAKVGGRTLNSPNLKPVSRLEILKETIRFLETHSSVTVRQIYYHLVSIQLINNNKAEYLRIVDNTKKGRLAGLLPFDKIIDDTREAQKTPSWNNIKTIIQAAISQYRSDWWIDQDNYVEVWLEKRSLSRIFYPITNYYDVNLCVGGGYQSWSEVWEAKGRFLRREGKRLVILYFGDLDPSGKDMPRDIKERLETIGIDVEVKEIALTKEDIEEYNLPRNPTKATDTRNRAYREKYGITWGVELDALPPDVLRQKIRDSISDNCDVDGVLSKRQEDESEKDYWLDKINEILENGY